MKTFEDQGSSMESTDVPHLPLSDLLEQFQGLPTVLFACNVDESVFTTESGKEEFERLFEIFGPAQFVYLPSFRRVRVGYETPQEAAKAKISLHDAPYKGIRLGIFFAQVVNADDAASSSSLLPPIADKQFLISPPASPPVGWEPVEENKPTFNFDLLSTIVELAPGQVHELHRGTESTPSVVVHVCEDSKESESARSMRNKIPQTRRPDC